MRERPDIQAVHLFGSLAEDRAVPGSDADVLILLERTERRWIDRPLEFLTYFDDVGVWLLLSSGGSISSVREGRCFPDLGGDHLA